VTDVLTPEELPPVREKKGFNLELSQSRVKREHLMHLSRQLAAFIRAGIPILQAVQTIADETDKKAVKRVMTAINDDLRGGNTLSEAIGKHPRDFPSFYRGILESAELTGDLESVLGQLSTYIERDLEARRKIKSAMIYPMVIAGVAVVTIVILSVFVLPKFEAFFASLDAQLPWPTVALLTTTRFMAKWWFMIVGVIVVSLSTLVIAYRIRPTKKIIHRTLLWSPVLGETIKFAVIERFCRLMASMIGAGVMLPEAMEVSTNSLNNLVFEDALVLARVAMEEGEGLATPISATGLFPGISGQMIRVGEDTGSLETQLEVAAQYYEKELDYKIKKLTALIEPLVIIVMGGVVGFVAVALVSAMYGIFRTAHLG